MLSLRKLAYFALFIAYVAGECMIESHRCDFPFQREGEVWYECMPGEENSDRHYCITQLGEKYVTGVCNGGCFEEDGSPVVFNSTSEDAVMAVFCKTKKSPCIFPFIWEGREYRECTTDGDTPFPWCALEVNDAGELVDNRWGQCDMSTCDPVSAADTESEPPKPKSVSVSFKEFSGELVFSQTTPEDALQVEGLLEGLPEDSDLQLAVVQGDCNQDIEQYLGKESMVDIQGLYEASSSVKAVIWVLSLYPGDQYLVGRSAIIKEQVTMLVLW
ncbi:uncharacterized protein LOC111700680 [Eurytemora carolleeae]|uniref:uncharacterized protein LOC111700680 n=1 Tax=Eurytemora carolleeae TaxID=1294199 RepID=UPI000C784274|nr:uncharacterized protein LOC111700680 [Eurytemora carolleeae]|eukprot:XP_023327446.1 uncharacterized protein LOC111700680 [Eurytemora affinis]